MREPFLNTKRIKVEKWLDIEANIVYNISIRILGFFK